MTNNRRVLLFPDTGSLATAVAERFIARISTTLTQAETATVVLTGGSVGIAVLAAVNASPLRDSLDWSRLNLWWGDERWLPRGHVDRNDHQAAESLLNHVALDPGRVHPFPASDEFDDLDAAATHYAHELAGCAADGEEIPEIDIVFLGVGPDGHIASLFPEQPGVRVTDATVIPVRNSPKPPNERLSLTLPTINSAARVWLVLAGPDKAPALGLALAGANLNEVPVAGASGRHETIFFVDAAAAAEVPESLIAPD